jgi:hypothetical protein
MPLFEEMFERTDMHPAVAYGGRHGFTRAQLKLHRGDASICPEGDTLYPSHTFDAVTDQSDGAEWVCAACDIRVVDIDEGGVMLVPCDHGEQPGYCDCGWEAGQR